MTNPNAKKYSPAFEPGHFFHVYNHAIGSELLFREGENYLFFLDKFSQFLSPYVSLYTYCLLPNHFHLLIKVSEQSNSEQVSEQFRKFLISYSKSFNKRFFRNGGLFKRHLKRVHVSSDEYLIWLIFYIHRNPVHHNYTKNFRTYPWSSYRSLISNKDTNLARDETMELFSGTREFISFHERNITEIKVIKEFLLE